ncbi:MFS transporter [Streptomyces sp. WAC 05379]|uniref:MFS transporter n=1 Tax=Streptomyces sp. WAC 05379 TaxID=2203207 RepID=UPI0021AE0F8B|nr:MFS transporter [Streptomyces sp. WAC 05379]
MTSVPLTAGLGVRRGVVLVLAVAGSITVSNIYFPQPLLEAVARGMRVSEATAGLVATAGQVGYALGISLLVPLADGRNLRRLTTVLLALTAGALLAGALAPSLAVLTIATAAASTTTVLPQIILPAAATMAGSAGRGRVVASVGIGLTLGSTLSRTLSGAVADLSGSWRASYVLAAVLTAALIFVLPRHMPTADDRVRVSYRKLLASMPGLLHTHRELRLSAFLGAATYAVFAAFWATLPFHLAHPPFDKGAGWAGLFGLLSLPAAILSYSAGKLSDAFGTTRVNALAVAGLGLALAVFATLGTTSVVALVVGANLLVYGTSCAQIANQARIFRLDEAVRARLNTLYMLFAFSGGAVGSLVGVRLYNAGGWTWTVLGCAAFLTAAGARLALHSRATRP